MRCSISNVSAAKAFQTVFYLHHKTYWPRNLSTQSSVEDTLKMRCQFLFQTAWNFTPFRAHVVTSSRLRPRPKVGLFMRRTDGDGVSLLQDKFDVCHFQVRLAECGSKNTFLPSASDGYNV